MPSPAHEQLGRDIELYVEMSGRLVPVLADAGAWLSVAVAIATGWDKWLKPEATFKAHYKYNDDFIAFRREWTLTPDGQVDLRKLSDRFKKLVDGYNASVL